MISKLTFLTAAMFAFVGIFSKQAVAQQDDASKDPTVVLMQTGSVTTCNALFYDTGGATGNYSGNENHFLVFVPETPGARIKVTFLEFETENNYDKLFVYNGSSPLDPLLATLTGANLPPEPFYGDNPNGVLGFNFTSDGSVMKPGWKATVECYTPVPNNLVALKLNTTPHATATEAKTIPFLILNQGTADVLGSAYTVQLQDTAGNILASANGVDLISGAQTSIDLVWTPSAVGTMGVKGVINFATDEYPGDNATDIVMFTIHPAGTYVAQIGPGATVSGLRIPFDFYYYNSCAQSIYTAEQLGVGGGIINKIVYKNNFPTSLIVPKGIRVWIGETTLTNLTGGFIDPADLTLVFDGEVEFPGGINDININLQTPYVYSGQNLVIYTYREYDTAWISNGCLFFLTSTSESRTRHRRSDTQLDPLAPTGGTATTYIPDITMFFSTAGLGGITGNVTSGGTPAEGVKVQIVGGTRHTTTDASGNYSLPYLIPGTYALDFTKFGYTDFNATNINVVGDSTTTVNATISPIQQYMVSGTITTSDTGLPVAGAVVNFYGYEDYTDTTDAAGHYSMSGVWGAGKEYEVVVDAEGYQQYNGTVTVTNAHITDHNIVVNEIAYPAGKVTATVEGENVNVTWLSPGVTSPGDPKWITWSGDADPDNCGIGHPVEYTIAHRFSAEQLSGLEAVDMFVSKIKFFPIETGTYKVQVWTGGSATDPGTLVHEQVALNVEYFQWNEVELTTPVVVPDGQELWYGVHIIPIEHYPAGVDEGPAITGFGDWIKIANGAWETLTSHGLSYNWALGALVDNGKGFVTNLSKLHAEYEMNDSKVNNGDGSNILSDLRSTSAIESREITIVGNSENSVSRALVDYTLYRLIKDQPQAEWTELIASTTYTAYTDTVWETLPAGLYQYAVVANYTNNVVSKPRLSNILAKDLETEYTVHVKDNADGAVEGATVTLTNHDGIAQHVYEGTTGATGDITFPTVWKGLYSITAAKAGYEPFAADSVTINANTTFPATIVEIIVTPNNLECDFDGNDIIFTWNNVYGVNVTLQADDVWGDGSGYQLLLDADAVEYGQTIPTSGWLADCNAPATLYDVFEYKIPENADPVCNTQNMICNNSATILVPVGTYDYCIVNPTPNDRLWIAAGENGRKDDYVFEEGKNYHFYVQFGGSNDMTTITVTDAKTKRVLDVVRPGAVVDENARIGEFTSDQISVVSIPEIGDYYNGTPSQTRAFNGYTVYLDGEEVASDIMETTYRFENVGGGYHTAGVKAVYTSGESEVAEMSFYLPPYWYVNFTVKRESDGTPIEGANVFVNNRTLTTDASGEATIWLFNGEYNYTVSKSGYSDFEGSFVVNGADLTIPVNMITGIDGFANSFVRLYPNPAERVLTIERSNSDEAVIELYNVSGALISTTKTENSTTTLDIGMLNSGSYFIRIIETNNTTIHRFIKQ